MSGEIVILTGAGISRESGLETFRDPDGIWAKIDLEDVATPAAFRRNPALVHSFYNARRRQLLAENIQPNAAHFALANLAQHRDVTLVTQNIDDLHERGGSPSVLHMHGELLKARFNRCRTVARCQTDLTTETRCTHCGAAGAMRPDVVWFGEMPMHMEVVEQRMSGADLFLSIGTSGTVYPAAGFVDFAKRLGARTVELNLEPSANAGVFDEGVYGRATEVVVQYVQRLL